MCVSPPIRRHRPSKRPRRTMALCAVGMLLTFLCRGCHAEDPSATTIPSESRQVHKYALPAFSMVLRVSVEQDLQAADDDDLYLDLEIFQETLEHVTQFHMADIFQQHHDQYADFKNEQFIRIQLSTKVREEINPDQYDTDTAPREHVPLHAGFSGVVSFSFPSDAVPPIDRVESAIATVLEDALVAENYLLLFRRYLSSGVLADIEDVYEIRIGTEQLTVLETSTKPLSDSETNTDESSSSQQTAKTSNDSNQKQINVVTIVAIVIFLTLSCLLMLFGATVVLVMKDRAKQEESLQGQTMVSIGMGTKKSTRTHNGEATTDEGKEGSDEDDSSTATPAWKRAVLPILRKAVTVRRYWKKQMRKQRKARKKAKAKEEPQAGTSSDDSSAGADDKEEKEDDGLNDDDVYYDESLSDDEAANQWLDAWQASITSIPVRSVKGNSASGKNPHSSPSKKHVKKKKTSKRPLAPRPATRQSKKAFLCCIAEEDSVVDSASIFDDLELGDQSLRSAKSPRELDRIEELTSVVLEEDYPATSPAYGASARKKKQQLQENITDDPFDRLSPTSSLSASGSSDEVLSPIQDVDLS
jgi:hypothetical protein